MNAQLEMTRQPVANSNALLDLLTIFEADRQIAIVERTPDPAISAYLDCVAHLLGRGFRIELNAGKNLPAHLLPEQAGREMLAEDIAFIAEAYSDLMGCTTVGLRLEVVRHAMCPRFHVDHTGIRLLCTYRGAGTEWLDDRFADRSRLGTVSNGLSDEESGIVTQSTGIYKVPPFAIALLKGSAWQGNVGGGIIHRSPPVSPHTAPRVLLALDALW